MSVRPPHFILFSESSPGGGVSHREKHGCDNAEANQGQWHFSLCAPDGSSKLDVAERESEPSQDRLDLLAVVRGLEALDQPSRVTLVTASGYVHRGLRFGLAAWRENGWQWERFGQMVPIKNRDLWQRVDRALEFHEVECRFARIDAAHDDLSLGGTYFEARRREQFEPEEAGLSNRNATRPDRAAKARRMATLARRVVQCLWPARPHRRLFAAAP